MIRICLYPEKGSLCFDEIHISKIPLAGSHIVLNELVVLQGLPCFEGRVFRCNQIVCDIEI